MAFQAIYQSVFTTQANSNNADNDIDASDSNSASATAASGYIPKAQRKFAGTISPNDPEDNYGFGNSVVVSKLLIHPIKVGPLQYISLSFCVCQCSVRSWGHSIRHNRRMLIRPSAHLISPYLRQPLRLLTSSRLRTGSSSESVMQALRSPGPSLKMKGISESDIERIKEFPFN
jgi:hypothetical protein